MGVKVKTHTDVPLDYTINGDKVTVVQAEFFSFLGISEKFAIFTEHKGSVNV